MFLQLAELFMPIVHEAVEDLFQNLESNGVNKESLANSLETTNNKYASTEGSLYGVVVAPTVTKLIDKLKGTN